MFNMAFLKLNLALLKFNLAQLKFNLRNFNYLSSNIISQYIQRRMQRP